MEMAEAAEKEVLDVSEEKSDSEVLDVSAKKLILKIAILKKNRKPRKSYGLLTSTLSILQLG